MVLDERSRVSIPPSVTSALDHPSEPVGCTSQRLRRAAKATRERSGTFAIGAGGKHVSASACARRVGKISASTVVASALGREDLRSSRKPLASYAGNKSSEIVSPSRQYEEI